MYTQSVFGAFHQPAVLISSFWSLCFCYPLLQSISFMSMYLAQIHQCLTDIQSKVASRYRNLINSFRYACACVATRNGVPNMKANRNCKGTRCELGKSPHVFEVPATYSSYQRRMQGDKADVRGRVSLYTIASTLKCSSPKARSLFSSE